MRVTFIVVAAPSWKKDEKESACVWAARKNVLALFSSKYDAAFFARPEAPKL
jgi:hypothetical protein